MFYFHLFPLFLKAIKIEPVAELSRVAHYYKLAQTRETRLRVNVHKDLKTGIVSNLRIMCGQKKLQTQFSRVTLSLLWDLVNRFYERRRNLPKITMYTILAQRRPSGD